MKVILLILVSSLILSGCFWNDKDVIITPPVQIEKQEFHPPPIRPVQLNNSMKFVVLTSDTATEVLAEGNYAYQCLSWSDYLILGQNMQSILSKFDEYEGLTCYYRRDLKEVRCEKFNIAVEEGSEEENSDG